MWPKITKSKYEAYVWEGLPDAKTSGLAVLYHSGLSVVITVGVRVWIYLFTDFIKSHLLGAINFSSYFVEYKCETNKYV